QVDVEGPHPTEPGDHYLLCSDGLSGQVSDREIGAVVGNLPPEEACRFLINLANLQGGPDNITAIDVHIVGQPVMEASPNSTAPGVAIAGPTLATRLTPVMRRLPWPLMALFLGISLAVVAIYLTAFEKPGDLPTFVVSAVALLSGLAGRVIER